MSESGHGTVTCAICAESVGPDFARAIRDTALQLGWPTQHVKSGFICVGCLPTCQKIISSLYGYILY